MSALVPRSGSLQLVAALLAIALMVPFATFSALPFRASERPRVVGKEQKKLPEKPLWHADLRPLGLKENGAGANRLFWRRVECLVFSGNAEILASFRTPESKAFSPWRVTAALLDAGTGTVQGSHEWAMRRTEAGLIATHDGNFLVRTDDRPPDQPLRPNRKLTLYSAKFEPLKEFPLQSLVPGEYEMWQVYATATRRSVVVEHGMAAGNEVPLLDAARGIEVLWLDPDTLDIKAKWDWSAPGERVPDETGLDFSDRGIVATLRHRAKFIKGEKGSCEINARRVDGPPGHPFFGLRASTVLTPSS
jgi:hypothetical protein